MLVLIVNFEVMNAATYYGNSKAHLMSGSLFRVGAGAALLTNRCDTAIKPEDVTEIGQGLFKHSQNPHHPYKCIIAKLVSESINMCRPKDIPRAKYELMRVTRTHMGQDDRAFSCMGYSDDNEGINGIYITKDVPDVTGQALQIHLTRLAPHVLPWTEQVSNYRSR